MNSGGGENIQRQLTREKKEKEEEKEKRKRNHE